MGKNSSLKSCNCQSLSDLSSWKKGTTSQFLEKPAWKARGAPPTNVCLMSNLKNNVVTMWLGFIAALGAWHPPSTWLSPGLVVLNLSRSELGRDLLVKPIMANHASCPHRIHACDLKIKLCQPVPNGQKVEASQLVKICHVYESHLQSSRKIFQKIPRQCIGIHTLSLSWMYTVLSSCWLAQ